MLVFYMIFSEKERIPFLLFKSLGGFHWLLNNINQFNQFNYLSLSAIFCQLIWAFSYFSSIRALAAPSSIEALHMQTSHPWKIPSKVLTLPPPQKIHILKMILNFEIRTTSTPHCTSCLHVACPNPDTATCVSVSQNQPMSHYFQNNSPTPEL